MTCSKQTPLNVRLGLHLVYDWAKQSNEIMLTVIASDSLYYIRNRDDDIKLHLHSRYL